MAKTTNPKSDPKFDDSALHKDFLGLSRPAQRALLTNGICSPSDLAKRTEADILSFHGMGPSSLPKLKQVLAKHKLALKED